MDENSAFGFPGIQPRWSTSAKDGVGTALSSHSSLWFTVSHGIVNEVYYPRIDTANTRDIQLIVTADGFFSEERRDTTHTTKFKRAGVPIFQIEDRCKNGRYRIRKEIFSDPDSDVLVQRINFKALKGKLANYRVHLLIAPHIDNGGNGNDAWIGSYKGIPMLFAYRNGIAFATCSDAAFGKMSCGYVGFSDLWQDLHANGRMTWEFGSAKNGNVSLGAEIIVPESGEFTIYIGFGATPAEAALKLRYSMLRTPDSISKKYEAQWLEFFNTCENSVGKPTGAELYEISLSVLKTHQAKSKFPGALIASLSIPWGNSKSDEDRGGYHLVWTRDMVETAMAQIAAGDYSGAESALRFLMVTQESDGKWPQNMWLDGKGYWKGVQLDEVAFPILLAKRLRKLGRMDSAFIWPMIRKASGFLLREGPSTQQDRWEEDGGLSPFTLAVEIGGLLAAADLAEENHEPAMAEILRQRADYYNEMIEFWTYVTKTVVATSAGVEGYYVRIAPSSRLEALPEEIQSQNIVIKNRPEGQNIMKAEDEISVDALALVRFGIRRADDPRIINTVRVIDKFLRSDTSTGPVWHRYRDDGYGEHDDGSAFDGTGRGRGWPLFSGERAHYEIAAGRLNEALKLRKIMESQTSPGGLIPEQIWDSANIPGKGLINGRPSGSAMPLVWAHAEYLKLCRSIELGKVFDMPEPTAKRYIENVSKPKLFDWTFRNKLSWIPLGLDLRISLFDPAKIIWTSDQWESREELDTRDSGLGIHFADIKTDKMKEGSTIIFTMYWKGPDKWEGNNFSVRVI